MLSSVLLSLQTLLAVSAAQRKGSGIGVSVFCSKLRYKLLCCIEEVVLCSDREDSGVEVEVGRREGGGGFRRGVGEGEGVVVCRETVGYRGRRVDLTKRKRDESRKGGNARIPE